MKASYRQILRTTSLVGGSSFVNILVGIARGKVMALIVGTSGVGLAGMFQSAVGLVEVLSGMGIRQAGVRQVALASSAGDPEKVARAVTVVRRAAVATAALGVLVTVLISRTLSRITFGTEAYAGSISLMSLTILFGALVAAYGAHLQGTRRIQLLAFSSVALTVCATVAGLVPILLWKTDGIVLMNVVGSFTALVIMWLFVRRVPVAPVRVSLRETWVESKGLLTLGFALMIAGLAGAAGTYVTQVLIRQGFDRSGVGLYLAASTLAGTYAKMLMSAMESDFYPRITSLVGSPAGVINRIVNEQIQLGVLIAVPGVVFTIAFAPWLLRLLCSPEFVPAAGITRWQVMSAAVQALSWPMTYVILAHGKSQLYMITECIFVGVWLGLLWVGLRWWGLEGAGVANLLMCLSYAVTMGVITRRLYGFRLTWTTGVIAAAVALLMAACTVWMRTQPEPWAARGGLVFTAVAAFASLAAIRRLTGLGLRDLAQMLKGRKGAAA